MHCQNPSKYDIYKAIGYIAVLLILAVPFSFLGLRLLNFALGNLPI